MKKFIFSKLSLLLIISIFGYNVFEYFDSGNNHYLIASLSTIVFLLLTISNSCLAAFVLFMACGITFIDFLFIGFLDKIISSSLTINAFLFIMWGSSRSPKVNYSAKKKLINFDHSFMSKLLKSDWYQRNAHLKDTDIDLELLINQSFYSKCVGKIVQLLIMHNYSEVRRTGFDKKDFLKIHAIATIYTMPMPISKNADGLVSVGTQVLLNIFSNVNIISKMSRTDIKNKDYFIKAAKDILEKSDWQYGSVSNSELEILNESNEYS